MRTVGRSAGELSKKGADENTFCTNLVISLAIIIADLEMTWDYFITGYVGCSMTRHKKLLFQ